MKNCLIYLILTLFMIGVVSGCSHKSAISTYTEPSQVIQVNAGQEFTIALSSNPTTGYDWEYTSVYTVVQSLGKTYQADSPVLMGSGGTDTFSFKANSKGTATLVFVYKRSWETTTADQKTFTVKVN